MGDVFRRSEYRFRVNQRFDYVIQICQSAADHTQPGALTDREGLESVFVTAVNPKGRRSAGRRKEDNERDDLTSNVKLAEALGLIRAKYNEQGHWRKLSLTDIGSVLAQLAGEGVRERVEVFLLSRMLSEVHRLPQVVLRLLRPSAMDEEGVALILGSGDLVAVQAMLRLLMEENSARGAVPLLVRSKVDRLYRLSKRAEGLIPDAWLYVARNHVEDAYLACRQSGDYAKVEDVCSYFESQWGIVGSAGHNQVVQALQTLAAERSERYRLQARPGHGPDYYFRVVGL